MNVVITGSTKGIGLGMAREFLKRGHDVTVSSRTVAAVERAAAELRAEFPARTIVGQPCDVGNLGQVQALWDAAAGGLGGVDIWINNAGRDGGTKSAFWEIPPESYEATIRTNLVGLMNCNHVAIPAMYAQGRGAIWNMEGFGSNGMVRRGASVYGTTKYALYYFTKSLAKELEGTPVRMCYLSPGMVVTEMLVPPPGERGDDWPQTRRVLNILADTVETVTPFLVEGMLKADRNGAAVRWLTRGKVIRRFLTARFNKNRDVLSAVGA